VVCAESAGGENSDQANKQTIKQDEILIELKYSLASLIIIIFIHEFP